MKIFFQLTFYFSILSLIFTLERKPRNLPLPWNDVKHYHYNNNNHYVTWLPYNVTRYYNESDFNYYIGFFTYFNFFFKNIIFSYKFKRLKVLQDI